MRNSKYPLMALGAYLALIGVLALTTSGPAYTQSGQPVGPNVRVVNTESEPVPVHDVGNQSRVPFQIQLTRAEPTYDVPADKQLVIEHVSGEYNTNAPRSFVSLKTESGDPPTSVEHDFVPTVTGTFNGFSDHVFSTAARLYANPGTEIRAFGGGANSLDVQISGYLVDAP